jgi:iron complex outermembrane receptor protein
MTSYFKLPFGGKKPLALALALCTAAPAIQAQESGGSLSSLLLEEVVVTAQKREQNIQDVPIAVTALDARLLQAQGIYSPSDLRNVIPNLAVGEYQGETKVNIRGVGQLILQSNPGIAIHIDGVYQSGAALAGLTQLDMAGVEVLRGPQGTTYGRNANGGAINYSTQQGSEEFGGYVLASIAEYEETRLQAGLSIPLSDTVRSRLTVDSWERGEGFGENFGAGRDAYEGDSLTARYRIDAELSDSVSGTFILTHAEVDGSFTAFDIIDPIPASVAARSPVNQIIFTAPNANNFPGIDFSQNTDSQQVREYQSASATFNWDINDTYSLKSITAVQKFDDLRGTDNDSTNADIVDTIVTVEQDTFTQEFNLTFSTDNASGVLGAFYLNDETIYDQLLQFRSPFLFGAPFPIPPGSFTKADTLPYEQTSLALFADVNYDLSDDLSLIAGIRVAQEEVELEQAGAFFFNFPTGLVPAGPPGAPPSPCAVAFLNGTSATQPTLDYDITTPRVGLNYAASEESNVYATYSEGFKSGGYGIRTGCGDDYDEETVKSFEIGSKSVLADGRLRLNANAFMYEYEGYQIEQLAGLAFVIDNIEEAEVIGIELESTYVVNDNLTLIANASHQKSEITKHFATDSLNPQLGMQDVSGNPLPGTPDTTVNLGFIYEMNNGLAFQLNAAYKSDINFREFDNSADVQEAYTLWNANIRWANEDDTINLRFFANNLTDEEYIQSVFATSLTGNRIGNFGAPRQIGAEIRYNF